jgi:glycerol-3-phosphate dehydrogenase
VEDVLARRTRILFLNAQAAMEAAPTVAQLMATLMNKNEDWKLQQINNFNVLAKQYLLS